MVTLCFIYALCHEDITGSGGIAPLFLTSVLDRDEWSVPRPGRLTPGKRASGTHWIGGKVGPRAGLDAVQKRKGLSLEEIEPQPVTCLYTD
jgi:hypothetical protein